jgi:hypothetical protein
MWFVNSVKMQRNKPLLVGFQNRLAVGFSTGGGRLKPQFGGMAYTITGTPLNAALPVNPSTR